MAQPIDIPILYTGLNSARPDWKSMGNNIRESFRNIKNDAIASKRYNDALKARERKEWMETVDVDRVNFANQQLQELELAKYNQYKDEVTGLAASRKGRLTEADLMAGKQVANQYANYMQGIKNQETQRQLDIKVIGEDIDKFDKEKANKILYWDYSKDGKYTGNELANALRFIPEEERVSKDKKLAKDTDRMATYFADSINPNATGDKYKTEVRDKYREEFYTEDGVDKNGRKKYKLNAENAVKYMWQEYSLPSKSQELNSLMVDFDKLPDWQERAIIDVWGREKAPVAWYTLKNSDKLFAIERSIDETVKVTGAGSVSDDKKDIDVTSGTGDFRDKPVKLSGTVSGAMTIDGSDIKVKGGLNDILFTEIKYAKNPKTNEMGWMAYGQYEEKSGKGFQITTDEQGNMTLSQGGDTKVVDFIAPYDKVKEPLERNYNFKGMNTYKPPKEEKMSPAQWNTEWSKLKKGETMVGLDGKTYTKR